MTTRRRSSPGRPAATAAAVPTCRHFGSCGSCSSLTTPIDQQLDAKVADLQGWLEPFLDGVRVQHTRPRRVPLHHRTRLLYPVRSDHEGRPILGMYRQHSHELVRIRECRTQDETLTAFGSAAERVVRGLGLRAFDAKGSDGATVAGSTADAASGGGSLIALHARLAPGTGELLIGVVTRPGLFDAGAELADRLLAAARELGARPVGVVRSITARTDGFLLGDRQVPLRGRDYLEDRQDGLSFRVSFGSFYQVHRDASALLYRPALRLAGSVAGQRVVDGYGGVGTFGLRCAAAGAAAVEIVEDNATACRDAEHNARKNGLDRVRVVRAAFATADFAAGPDLLIVDPPRSGLQAAGVARVLAARPRRLLHVACSAAELARDVEVLWRRGYRIQAARLCDMFPHTDHVEAAVLLTAPPGG